MTGELVETPNQAATCNLFAGQPARRGSIIYSHHSGLSRLATGDKLAVGPDWGLICLIVLAAPLTSSTHKSGHGRQTMSGRPVSHARRNLVPLSRQPRPRSSHSLGGQANSAGSRARGPAGLKSPVRPASRHPLECGRIGELLDTNDVVMWSEGGHLAAASAPPEWSVGLGRPVGAADVAQRRGERLRNIGWKLERKKWRGQQSGSRPARLAFLRVPPIGRAAAAGGSRGWPEAGRRWLVARAAPICY